MRPSFIFVIFASGSEGLGHALAGAAVHALSARDMTALRTRARLLALVAAADLDLLLRFVDGRNHHQGASHSIGAALAGTAGLLFARAVRWPRPTAFGLAAGLAWLSHVLLDLFGSDTNPPIGLMALWPLHEGYLGASWLLFMDIGRDLNWHTVRHNAVAAAWEATVMAPILAVCWWWRRVALSSS